MLRSGMFYRHYGKRWLDICGSALGLLVLSPLFLLVAIAVKCGSGGPVFYGQPRVGKNGRTFIIWKFRSMVDGAERIGPSITFSGDPRITPVGRFLRKWKLDELPQLWNVLKGDMSLVGPRPELPLYVANYTAHQRQVFTVRPGITDPASLKYRDEEQILAAVGDREHFYKEVVLPHKLTLSLDYIQGVRFWLDIVLILRTMKVLPASSMTSGATDSPPQGTSSP